ncbi:MAG: TRAP transporter permease, partial [Acidaminococcaceae bacterium]|nr:TRAP transporter permease [Acidaminococcaceae bacterium]
MNSENIKEMTADEVLKKFDQESNKREMTGLWGKIISAICIAFAAFQIYTAVFGVLDAHLQRAIHLAFGFALIFLLYPARTAWSKDSMSWFDVLLA